MRMRMMSGLALFVFIFFSLAGTSVSAEEVTNRKPRLEADESGIEKKESTLELKASTPEGFDKIILINFTSKSEQNIMSRLDKLNSYVSSQEIGAGTYEVGFISIVGENANAYAIKAPEEIIINEGSVVHFDLQIALKPSAKKPDSKAETDAHQPKQRSGLLPNKSTILEMNKESLKPSSTDMPDEANQVALAVAEKEKQTSNTVKDSSIKQIIGLGIILLLVLLNFVYKQLMYKHEYYDC